MIKSLGIKLILLLIVVAAGIWGWSIFDKLAYNRTVETIDILKYRPKEVEDIIYISRGYIGDNSSLINILDSNIVNLIEDDISYPLAVIKLSDDEIFLSRANKDQEISLKEKFSNVTGFEYTPSVKTEDNFTFFFYSVNSNGFISIVFHEGLFLVGKDYKKIKKTLNSLTIKGSISNSELEYLRKCMRNNAMTYFHRNANNNFIYNSRSDSINYILDGEYFYHSNLDTTMVSFAEIQLPLDTNRMLIDSILRKENNKIEIWINKSKSRNVKL